MKLKDLRGAMDLYAELMVTQPEMEQQLKLIVEYKHMLRNINMEYIELIKVELQTKIFKQHKDKSRITPRIDPRDSDMTGSQFREQQHDGAKQMDNLVPLKLGSQGQHTSSESFKQSSKKDALLVTPKITNLKKDDKKGLKCSISGCDFTTSATKKAKKQIRKHEEKHRKEKTIVKIAENTNTI